MQAYIHPSTYIIHLHKKENSPPSLPLAQQLSTIIIYINGNENLSHYIKYETERKEQMK